MMRILTVPLFLLALGLAACGQSGDLYLPDKNASDTGVAAPSAAGETAEDREEAERRKKAEGLQQPPLAPAAPAAGSDPAASSLPATVP